jgi:hypothetical protein
LASTLSDPEEIAGHTPVVAEPTTGKPHLAIQQLRGQRHEAHKSATAQAVRYRPGQQRHEPNKSGTARAVRYRPVFQKPLNYRPTSLTRPSMKTRVTKSHCETFMAYKSLCHPTQICGLAPSILFDIVGISSVLWE